MSFQTPIPIAEAIRNIETNRYLLPSIQREFVWSHERIEWLFDSIMRNYPISSFLFWRVEGDTRSEYKFYQLIREFRQRYKTHNEEFSTSGSNEFCAILDGQQRLTSLYIGLMGSYAYKTPRLKEEDTERVYPTRKLYLNIIEQLDNQEDGRIYEFKFLKQDEASDSERWFPVQKICDLADFYEFTKYLKEHDYDSNDFAFKSLAKLQNVIHTQPLINYFLEKDQDIDKALNIFIRINSGGQPLDFSDLLMSIAIANWNKKDARKEIYGLVDNIRDRGFYSLNKDFILKVFLYLHSGDIRFKVSNFAKENAQEFERQWERIREAILTIFDLMKTFGFTDRTLVSKNALIPVIYYIYHRNIAKEFHNKTEFAEDREIIKKWLHVSLVKRLFGGSSDTILSQIRKAFTSNIVEKQIDDDMENFPDISINEQISKDTSISDEFIERLLSTQKEDHYTFSILSLLFPNLDYKNNKFHLDHLHPASDYDNLSENQKEKYSWSKFNSIDNLQMLDANENMSKSNQSLSCWVENSTVLKDRQTFLLEHLIPDVELDLNNFDQFIDKRSELLALKLKSILLKESAL